MSARNKRPAMEVVIGEEGILWTTMQSILEISSDLVRMASFLRGFSESQIEHLAEATNFRAVSSLLFFKLEPILVPFDSRRPTSKEAEEGKSYTTPQMEPGQEIEMISLRMQEIASFLQSKDASEAALILRGRPALSTDIFMLLRILYDYVVRVDIEGRSSYKEAKEVKTKTISQEQVEEHIEQFCVQMEEVSSLLREKIELAAAFCCTIRETKGDVKLRINFSERTSQLPHNMSELKSFLLELEPAADHQPDEDSEYDDAEYQGVINWEEMLSAQKRLIEKESAEEMIRDKLPLIPYRQEYKYLEREEETEATKSAKEQIAMELKIFADYRKGMEHLTHGGSFEATTRLSPMHYTHCTPGVHIGYPHATPESSLQIFSFKIVEIKGDLKWPICVYGMVNARDSVDRNRNILFRRTRDNYQEVTQDDSFLHLTGPSRGIVAVDPLEFEVQLRVKGISESRDRSLISQRYHYAHGEGTQLRTLRFDNCLCTAELNLEQVANSVQATILGVRILEGGPCTFEYGGRVACSSPLHEVALLDCSEGIVFGVSDCTSTQVVLLDSNHCDGGKLPMGKDGYFDLSRRVVSVQLQRNHIYYPEKSEGSLKIVVQAYSQKGVPVAEGHVKFRPKLCNISQAVCDVGDTKVEITVAWSVFVLGQWSFSG